MNVEDKERVIVLLNTIEEADERASQNKVSQERTFICYNNDASEDRRSVGEILGEKWTAVPWLLRTFWEEAIPTPGRTRLWGLWTDLHGPRDPARAVDSPSAWRCVPAPSVFLL